MKSLPTPQRADTTVREKRYIVRISELANILREKMRTMRHLNAEILFVREKCKAQARTLTGMNKRARQHNREMDQLRQLAQANTSATPTPQFEGDNNDASS